MLDISFGVATGDIAKGFVLLTDRHTTTAATAFIEATCPVACTAVRGIGEWIDTASVAPGFVGLTGQHFANACDTVLFGSTKRLTTPTMSGIGFDIDTQPRTTHRAIGAFLEGNTLTIDTRFIGLTGRATRATVGI